MIKDLVKLFKIIDNNQKKRFYFLLIFLFFGMILEAFGIGIIIPLINLLLEPNILDIDIFNKIYIYLGLTSTQSLINIFLITAITLFIFKTLYLTLITYYQVNFLSKFTAKISSDLFEKYLNQDYSFHVKNSSSSLIKNIQVEINFLYTYCMAFLILLLEIIMSLAIIITLVIIEPIGALCIAFMFTLFAGLFLSFTRNKIIYWGNKRESIDKNISKNVLNSLGGIKDIIINQRSEFFIKILKNLNYSRARINSNFTTLTQIPRYYFELIAISGIIIFVFILTFNNYEVNSIIAKVGVFVAGSFKVIPSYNRIVSSLQNMKYYKSSIDIISSQLEDKGSKKSELNNNSSNFNFYKCISFENVSFSYENKKIFSGLNFKIKKGTTIGIMGSSGQGKTTLINLILGLFVPQSGNIFIDNYTLRENLISWRKIISYVPQEVFLTEDSIKSNICFGLDIKSVDLKKIKKAITEAQLDEFINQLPNGIDTLVGERGIQISGGQKQRIGLARALYNNPEVIIMDEGTSALDKETENGILSTIKNLKGKKTIIMIAHNKDSLKHCDSIFELNNTKLIRLNSIT